MNIKDLCKTCRKYEANRIKIKVEKTMIEQAYSDAEKSDRSKRLMRLINKQNEFEGMLIDMGSVDFNWL